MPEYDVLVDITRMTVVRVHASCPADAEQRVVAGEGMEVAVHNTDRQVLSVEEMQE